MDRTLSNPTTPGQNGPESDGNEGVHHIPQSFTALLEPRYQIISEHSTH